MGGSAPPGLGSRLCDPVHVTQPLWALAASSVNGDKERVWGGGLSEPEGVRQPSLLLKLFWGQGSCGEGQS